MTWHRPKSPRRGPLPKGSFAFRFKVKPHDPPEGAHPFAELEPIIARRLKGLKDAAAASAGAHATYQTEKSVLLRAVADLPACPVPADIREWRDGLIARWGCTVRTANKFRDSVSAAYEYDRGRGGQVNNPCLDVKRLKASAPVKPALSDPKAGLSAEEIFRRSLAALPELRQRAALALCYMRGLRRSEMCGLEHFHFDLRDLDHASVRLAQQRIPHTCDGEAQPLKTERRRVLPLPRWLAEMIQELLRQPAWVRPAVKGANQYTAPVRSRWVFPFNTGDLREINDVVRGISPEALPSGRGLHELRHAFAEGALQRFGGDLKEVGRRLGHSSEAVTAHYARGRYGSFEVRPDAALDEGLFSTMQNPPSPGVGAGGQAELQREKRVDSGTPKVNPPNAPNAQARRKSRKNRNPK